MTSRPSRRPPCRVRLRIDQCCDDPRARRSAPVAKVSSQTSLTVSVRVQVRKRFTRALPRVGAKGMVSLVSTPSGYVHRPPCLREEKFQEPRGQEPNKSQTSNPKDQNRTALGLGF